MMEKFVILCFLNLFIYFNSILSQTSTISSDSLVGLCKNHEASNICDNHNLLDDYQTKSYNDKLKSTFTLACAPTPPPQHDKVDDEPESNNFTCRCGIYSYLVLIKNINGLNEVDKKMKTYNLAKKELELIENDDCAVILLASQDDKIFSIAVGDDAKEYFTDKCLLNLFEKSDAKNFSTQLDDKLEEYLKMVEQMHDCIKDEDMYDDYDLRRKVAIPILLMLAALIIAIVVGICIIQRRRNQKRNMDESSSRPLKA